MCSQPSFISAFHSSVALLMTLLSLKKCTKKQQLRKRQKQSYKSALTARKCIEVNHIQRKTCGSFLSCDEICTCSNPRLLNDSARNMFDCRFIYLCAHVNWNVWFEK
mmetsp:Transcript_20066/g.27957  ORF Transcript_20066/g.27957 Transcript_20066/m.27957 type:complete len:107 (+) Transcript_20066:1042-1362(+)